jgi:hypothetical protein
MYTYSVDVRNAMEYPGVLFMVPKQDHSSQTRNSASSAPSCARELRLRHRLTEFFVTTSRPIHVRLTRLVWPRKVANHIFFFVLKPQNIHVPKLFQLIVWLSQSP